MTDRLSLPVYTPDWLRGKETFSARIREDVGSLDASFLEINVLGGRGVCDTQHRGYTIRVGAETPLEELVNSSQIIWKPILDSPVEKLWPIVRVFPYHDKDWVPMPMGAGLAFLYAGLQGFQLQQPLEQMPVESERIERSMRRVRRHAVFDGYAVPENPLAIYSRIEELPGKIRPLLGDQADLIEEYLSK